MFVLFLLILSPHISDYERIILYLILIIILKENANLIHNDKNSTIRTIMIKGNIQFKFKIFCNILRHIKRSRIIYHHS